MLIKIIFKITYNGGSDESWWSSSEVRSSLWELGLSPESNESGVALRDLVPVLEVCKHISKLTHFRIKSNKIITSRFQATSLTSCRCFLRGCLLRRVLLSVATRDLTVCACFSVKCFCATESKTTFSDISFPCW